MTRTTLTHLLRTLTRVKSQWTLPVVSKIQRTSRDPFQILISCLLSLRTKDEVTDVASARLFQLARTPTAMLRLPTSRIAKTIYPVGFYRTKARTIKRICRLLLARYHGRVPNTLDELLALPGVGRKTANLVVTLGFHQLGICVDTHVHRVSNRLGLVRTKTPEHTEFALRRTLPTRYWIEYNELFVSFGRTICRPISPWCSRCPIARWCPQVGVTTRR